MNPSAWQAASLLGLLGLLLGSFLNVLIARLPPLLERRWAGPDPSDAAAGKDPGDAPPGDTTELPNLWRPGSHCPQCLHPLAWHDLVPVLSYLHLRGQCRHCGQAIGQRYPLVELGAALILGYCGWRWGLRPEALAWGGFGLALLALGAIDWDTTWLPDDLTQPLLWTGLCVAALGLTKTPLTDAFWGAVAGYLSLWTVYQGFKLLTGKEGMGHGDFKMLAAIGAWLGWQSLLGVVLLASIGGAVVGLWLKARGRLGAHGYLPFGPFLALATGCVVVWGRPLFMGPA